MTAQDYARRVNVHYGRRGLGIACCAARLAADNRLGELAAGDLDSLDHFHTRGKAATRELARLANLRAGEQVLDVGGGLGGAARTLAREWGCRVTVLDLTEAFCRVGARLTAHFGMDDCITFRHGSALDLPFAAASFDVGWMEHVSMNVTDKERLYRGIYQVLRPGGRLALHEIMAGSVAPIHFPVPWARDQRISFLQPVAAMRQLLVRSGFEQLEWVDVTALSLAWHKERGTVTGAEAPGIRRLLGADFGSMIRNMARNLQERRLVVAQAVYARP